MSKLRGMSTKPSEVETDPFSSKLKGPSRLPSASSSQIDTQSSETRKLSVRRKAGTSAAIATTEIVNPLAEEPATTSKSFPENEGANLALSSEAAPALNNSIFNSKSLSSHQLANTDAVDLELSVQRPFETPSKPKLASGIPSSITKLLPDDFYPFVDRVRMRRSSSSEHQSSADVDIVPKSRASSAQILGKTVKAPPTIQNLEQFESIRAEVVQQLKENDLAFNPDITKLQDTGIESAYSSNRLSISGIPTPSKRKPTIESETPLEAPKSSFNPIYDDARIDSLLAKKNTTRTEPHLTPTKKSTSLKPVLTNLENIGESLSLQKVSPALKQSVVNLLLQPQIVESSTTSPLTVPEIIPVKKGLEDWESRILETGSFPSSLSSFDRQGLDHLDSSSNDNSETKAAILQGSLHQNHAHLLPVEIFLSKDYPNVNELSPKISISKSATSSRPPTPKKPKTPSPEKAFKKLTRQSTLENEEIFAISDERPSNDSVSKNSPISQNISLSVESETLSKFENMDEDALRVQLMKFYHKNVLLTNEKAQIEKTISNMNAKHGEEIFELKKSLEDRSHIDTVRQSFNALLEKYESAKLDIENSRLYQEKLQKELKQAKKELHLLQAENDFSKDSAEMSVIDKCVLEEQLETMKEEMQILADRNEELSLQIELQLSKPTNSNADNWADKHQLVVLNSRLSEALVKLRDVALAREEELKDKIKIKDLDISRLNDLSGRRLH